MKTQWCNYKKSFIKALDGFVFDEKIIKILKKSSEKKQTIYVCGNGGSAALANHFSCDFSKSSNNTYNKFKIVSLVSNVSTVTAISNDDCYKNVFSTQLFNLAKENDILFLISSSGNSKNIIEAIRAARKIKMIVIGLCGFSGGYLLNESDYVGYVNEDNYGIVEDVHSSFLHYILKILSD